MRTFAIHEANLERLTKKINRIRTKCAKYGCDFHFSIVGDEYRELKNEDGSTYIARYILVEAEGTAVVNGWKFVATVDHTEAGNIIRNAVDIQIPDRYRTADPECEHCKSRRHRKETYIVYNEETNEFKQVGSSCLNDFTHGLSAEGVAGYIELFDSLIEGEAPYAGIDITPYFQTEDILLRSIEWVKHFGYIPTSSYERSTKQYVMDSIYYESGRMSTVEIEEYSDLYTKYLIKYDTPENRETLEKMVEYIKGLEENSDYIKNLQIIVELPYLKFRHIGYAVSIISCYNRYIEKEDARQARAREHAEEAARSHHIGAVGDRINIKVKDINVVTSWETQFGCTHMYKLVDEDGNVFIWCTDKYLEVGPKPELINLVGTIKKHDQFNSVCQTWITRCKIA